MEKPEVKSAKKTVRKILVATGIFPPEIGGPATYAKLLTVELPKRGIQVSVLPYRGVRKYPKILRHIAYFFKIVAASRGCDLIFTQDPVSTGVPAVFASWLTRKKLVLRVAGDYAWEQSRQRYGVKEEIDEFQKRKYSFKVEMLRRLQRFSVRHADVVYSPSKYFSNLVAGWLHGEREVLHIYNGIELTDDFEKKEKFADKTIITAGRMVPWKGFDILIGLLDQLPGWKLVIAGDGPDRARLEKLISEKHLQERVSLLGNLPRLELFSYKYRSHVFILLSKFESFSLQVVEAMHVGLPVIAANIGNLSEIITNGKDGLLVDPDNHAQIIESINKVSTDENYARRLAESARKRAADFSIDRTIDRLVQIFHSVIG